MLHGGKERTGSNKNARSPGAKPGSSKFELLLAWLDEDRDKAAGRYEEMRKRLISYFRARRCYPAPELADETFERVTARIGELFNSFKGNPDAYFFGVGRNLVKEHRRKPRMMQLPEPLLCESDASEENEKELRSLYLSRSLEGLRSEERDLILRYYSPSCGPLNRSHLSEELGISRRNLRIRVHRIRKRLAENFWEQVELDQ